jgi:hypothetical protein
LLAVICQISFDRRSLSISEEEHYCNKIKDTLFLRFGLAGILMNGISPEVIER